ncbi:MAG: hypothetical protein QXU98_05440, partial [Candidatus Parvarchaeota archaeon]
KLIYQNTYIYTGMKCPRSVDRLIKAVEGHHRLSYKKTSVGPPSIIPTVQQKSIYVEISTLKEKNKHE